MGQAAAARLLMQGTFGATTQTLSSTAAQSYSQWFAAQAAITPSLTLPSIINAPATVNPDWSPTWFSNVIQGQDQLRQRMAFALSEILVVSGAAEPLFGYNQMLANYYDTLVNDALGNYYTLLRDVTLTPAMGRFLSMMQSDKPNPATGVHADQNYAREIMQLFTIGLVKLNIDGSVQTDSSGNPVPTYAQVDVVNLANALTGWASAPTTHTGDTAWQYDLNYTAPMVAYEDHHDTDAKTIIGGVQLPAGQTAEQDLQTVLQTLFNHPNVGPFISKQLIQRLVTSNPSPAYVQRVAQVFNNDGTGTRGNLLALAQAILTDPEAVTAGTAPSNGKLREPLLRLTNLWRAFNGSNSAGASIPDVGVNVSLDTWFGEYPLMAPSVFNFFQPSFQVAGNAAMAGMVAPEFQILNEATLVDTENGLHQEAYQYVDSTGTSYSEAPLNTNNVLLHTAQWESLAANPAALVDEMNLILMGGEMSPGMRTALINYATAIPASTAGTRVAETAELIISSPQYAVQR
jgi:uncharacterized protein (DUF1800 family)